MIETSANSASPRCPENEAIRIYATGGLDDHEAEQIESHLLACPHCETLLDRLDDASDAVIQALATLPMSPDDEVAYQELRKAALSNPVALGNSADASAQLQLADRLADPDLGPLPCRLGSYELLACIGRGASGAVYRAQHLKLDQTVAVKVLDSSRAIDPASFLQEMKTIGSLTHPNIVRATDAGEADGLHFLVMEYVEGVDAARVLFRNGPLRVADACEIARQAALGLQFVHQQSLIHRDVKPSNLLVTVEGQVKLLDLGIATRSDQTPPDDDAPARPQGTYDYMAPEAWHNPAAIDERSDLYSLGCTLYKLLVAKVPARDGELDATSLAPLPRTLQRLLRSLLAEDPSQRPASMQNVIDALQPICRDADLPALIAKASPQLATLVSQHSTAQSGARRHLLTRRAALTAAAGLGAATFLLPRLKLFSAPALRRLTWRPLIPLKPSTIFAASDASLVEDKKTLGDELVVGSSDLALVNMGRPITGLFSIAVDIAIEDSANCGVFFRGQYDFSQPELTFQFQCIQLLQSEDSAALEYRLLWSQATATRDGGAINVTQTPLAEVDVELAADAPAQHLQLTCGRQGMPEVLWNGKSMHESLWRLSAEGRVFQRLSAGLLPTAFLGRIGLVSAGGSTIFRNPRLAYL